MRHLSIALMACAAASVPVGAAAKPSATGPIARTVAREAATGFNGVVLVARGERIQLLRAYGSVRGAKVRPDSRFWISSTGKQFVAAAILLLQEQGKLSLDDPISRWLAEAPADKRAITIRQLLSHTSGIVQGYEGEESASNAEAARRILAVPLETPRVHRFIYSNENYQLAAAIVERVSGQNLQDFEEQHLFAPLAMKDTGIENGPAQVLPTREPTPDRLLTPQWGIEGHYSSAPDLFRWYRALGRGQVLRKKSLDELWSPVVAIGEGEAGLGWFLTKTPLGTHRVWTRGNDDFGPNSLIYGYPDRDITIVVLSHSGDKPGGQSWSREMVTALEKALAL